MFALLFSSALSFGLGLGTTKNICIAKSKDGCPSGYEVNPPEEVYEIGSILTTEINVFVIVDPKNPIEFKHIPAGAEITIEGKDPSNKISIKGSTGLLSSLTSFLVTYKFKNIEVSTSDDTKLVAKQLDLEGKVSFGTFKNLIYKLNLGDEIKDLASDVEFIVQSALFTFNEENTKTVMYGKNKVMVNIGDNDNHVIIKVPKFISLIGDGITFAQKKGDLIVKRFGNPDINEILKTKIEAYGGNINLAAQKWKKAEGLVSNLLTKLNMIDIVQKSQTKIKISGLNIPANIKNEASDALNIVVDKAAAGVQGIIQITNNLDKIVGEGLNKFELAVGKFEIDAEVAFDNFDTKMSLALESWEANLESKANALFAKIERLVTNFAGKLETITQKALDLATNAVLSVDLKFDALELKSGFIDVTEKLSLPEVGKVLFEIPTAIPLDADFTKIKELVTTPRKIFCSKIPFDCNKFNLKLLQNITGLDLPKVIQQCDKDEQGRTCLSIKLESLPSWLPEKYCIGTADTCPAGSVSLTDFSQIKDKIHDLTKGVNIDFKDGKLSGTFEVGDYVKVGGSLNLAGGDSLPTVDLSVKAGDKAASLSMDKLTLNFKANDGDKVVFKVPALDLSLSKLTEDAKGLAYDFMNTKVLIDASTFKEFVKAKFNDLLINPMKAVSKLTIGEGFKIGEGDSLTEIAKDTVSGILSLAELEIPQGTPFNVDVEGSITKTNGLGFNIKAGTGNSEIKFGANFGKLTDLGKGIKFETHSDVKINLPGNLKAINLSGSGNFEIGLDSSSPKTLTLSGETQVMGGDRTIKLSGTAPADFSIVLDKLKLEEGKVFKILDSSSQEIIPAIKELVLGAKAHFDAVNVINSLTASFGSDISIGTLKFNVNNNMRKLLADDNNKNINIEYKFDSVPHLHINKAEGQPNAINMIFKATQEDMKDFVKEDYLDNPYPIITANFSSMEECKKWKSAVKSVIDTPGVSKLELNTYCEQGVEDETSYTISIALKDIDYKEPNSGTPTTSPENQGDDKILGLPKAAFFGIVAGAVLVLIIVVIIVVVACKKKKSEKKSKRKKSKKRESSSSSFYSSS